MCTFIAADGPILLTCKAARWDCVYHQLLLENVINRKAL